MKKSKSVKAYIQSAEDWVEELTQLHNIFLKSGMEEAIKWGRPVYMVDGKNVAGFSAFKNHYALWFFNGVFLKDEAHVLINANEDKTKALRQWRFEKGDVLDEKLILNYLQEATENQRQGKELKPEPKKESIPPEMQKFFEEDKDLETFFNKLTRGKRIEYGEYIAEAKQDKTKIKRMQKIIPMIKEGKGLHDKYRNC